ncbi:MAG: hypothetical protein KBG84_08645 [Planctomycetes bacterium]|nr:hypothetical protein [Planctomycetota bacterium]
MRQISLLALLFGAALVCLAGVSHLQADSAPGPGPRPRPVPPPVEKPKDDRPRAESVELVKDEYASFASERSKEGNFVFSLSFTVPAGNYDGVLDVIKRDEENRTIRVYATAKPTGEMGPQVLSKRTVKPEFSNLKTGKYVVQLHVRVRDGEYEPRTAWVIDAK